MKRTVPFVLIGVLAVAGCGGNDEPAPMPTPEESLTTATAVPPADDTEQTSTAPADDDPTTSAPDDVEATSAPPDADIDEDSEAGAEAFARHYIELINQTGMEPEEGVLEPLGAPGCKSCDNYAANVSYLVENGLHNSGPALTVESTESTVLGKNVFVLMDITQPPYDVVDADGNVEMSYEATSGKFKVDLTRAQDNWVVTGITVSED